jgi:hypothetical protein
MPHECGWISCWSKQVAGGVVSELPCIVPRVLGGGPVRWAALPPRTRQLRTAAGQGMHFRHITLCRARCLEHTMKQSGEKHPCPRPPLECWVALTCFLAASWAPGKAARVAMGPRALKNLKIDQAAEEPTPTADRIWTGSSGCTASRETLRISPDDHIPRGYGHGDRRGKPNCLKVRPACLLRQGESRQDCTGKLSRTRYSLFKTKEELGQPGMSLSASSHIILANGSAHNTPTK